MQHIMDHTTQVTFNAAAPSANQPSGYKEFKAIADSLEYGMQNVIVHLNQL